MILSSIRQKDQPARNKDDRKHIPRQVRWITMRPNDFLRTFNNLKFYNPQGEDICAAAVREVKEETGVSEKCANP